MLAISDAQKSRNHLIFTVINKYFINPILASVKLNLNLFLNKLSKVFSSDYTLTILRS